MQAARCRCARRCCLGRGVACPASGERFPTFGGFPTRPIPRVIGRVGGKVLPEARVALRVRWGRAARGPGDARDVAECGARCSRRPLVPGPRRLDQGGHDAGVLAHLRVPLHAQRPTPGTGVRRPRPCRPPRAPTPPGPGRAGPPPGGGTWARPDASGTIDPYSVPGDRLHRVRRRRRPPVRRVPLQVLDQRPAERHVEQLHAPADAEQRASRTPARPRSAPVPRRPAPARAGPYARLAARPRSAPAPRRGRRR